MKYTNAFRKSKGKPAQLWNKELHDECYNHAKYQADKGKISHDNFKVRVSNVRKKGVGARGAAENVCYNYDRTDPARKAVDQWIKSPGHNANMLRGNNVQATAMFVKGGRKYFCQMFLNVPGYSKDSSGQTAKYGPK